MGIFGTIFNPVLREIGGAVGGAAGSLFGNKGREIGESIGKEGASFAGNLIPFANGGAVIVMPKRRGARKGAGSMAMKRKMAKVRAAKRK